MRYRKIKADRLFTGREFSADVLVLNEEGIVQDIVNEENAGDDVEYRSGILAPGLINCHCHLELSHMLGKIPEKTGLVDFVFRVVTERNADTAEMAAAIEQAESEMLQNGIVAVGDICNNLSTLEQKKKGNLYYYNFIEASGWLPAAADVRFERAKALYENFLTLSNSSAMVPHAPYSVSQDLWRRLSNEFTGKVITIHNQETVHEDEFFQTGKGDFLRMYQMMNIDNSHHQPTSESSIRSYLRFMQNASSALLVHNTFTTEGDVLFAQEWSQYASVPVYFCLCINANLYIEEALPPVLLLANSGCNLVLGTDSLASNHSLSIVDEMKKIHSHFPEIGLDTLLQWATLNGARALEIDDTYGSFEQGKRPGVVLLNKDLSVVERLV